MVSYDSIHKMIENFLRNLFTTLNIKYVYKRNKCLALPYQTYWACQTFHLIRKLHIHIGRISGKLKHTLYFYLSVDYQFTQ